MDIKDFNFDDFDFDTNVDFGIKSVSSDQVDQTKIQTEKLEKVSVSSENVSQKLEQIENKLEEVLGVAQKKYDTRLEEKESELTVGNQEKFKVLEKLMIPLLMNLSKDSDTNPYIHWPNRKQVVEEQIKRILTVTRGE
tara:strand:+ start:1120 stop:1533 length:414 start_codon:yes stop_codon:yes gene_type:complete